MHPTVSSVPERARVLLVEESLPYRRVIREALTSFRLCEVDDCPLAERAFEMALHCPYQLLIVAVSLPDMSGVMLDRLIARAYPLAHPGSHTAPPVIFLTQNKHNSELTQDQRNARRRGAVTYPPRLDILLPLTVGLLPERLPQSPLAPPSRVSR